MLQSRNFALYFSLVFSTRPFLRNTTRKCVHTTKKCATDFFLCFCGDFERIPRWFQRIFSRKKKYFPCHPPKAAIRRLRMEMKLYLNISLVRIQTKKLLLLVAFRVSLRSTFPWSRSPSYTSLFTRFKTVFSFRASQKDIFREFWRYN